MKKIYITTSIPYVNGRPHIGHALELVQADAFVRSYREEGYDAFLLTGTDENAQKNVESAEKAGIPTAQLVEQNSNLFQDLTKVLNVTNDDFIRTTSKKHFQGAQKLWQACLKDICKKKYTGLYCVGCETFYKEGEFPDNICPLHKRKLEEVSEENYFFALSKYQKQLEELIESDKVQIEPVSKKNEVLGFIKKGLEDFSISRPSERLKGWGVPVPGDDTQRMYVWFDALTNYITALDYASDSEKFKKYWLENNNKIHIIGKDIVKFHAMYWVAMLLSANLPTPDKIFVHGFITVDGQKMSKTLGNVIDPFELVKTYGLDAVRYYLLKEIPPLGDGDFSLNRMKELYNSDLANELGNLLSRVTTLAAQDGIVFEPDSGKNELWEKYFTYQFHEILDEIWNRVKEVNKDINEKQPWNKKNAERLNDLQSWLNAIHKIGISLSPLLPDTSKRIITASEGKITKQPPLFPRLRSV